MQELIALNTIEFDGSEQQTVNARELHEFLEVGKDFSNWIKDLIEKYGFVENVDYVRFSPNLAKTPYGGRPSVEYHISLSIAKELCMVERNEKGKQARQYFIECERGGASKSSRLNRHCYHTLKRFASWLIRLITTRSCKKRLSRTNPRWNTVIKLLPITAL